MIVIHRQIIRMTSDSDTRSLSTENSKWRTVEENSCDVTILALHDGKFGLRGGHFSAAALTTEILSEWKAGRILRAFYTTLSKFIRIGNLVNLIINMRIYGLPTYKPLNVFSVMN